ncbi:uncharacterized protein PAC_05529 [Phialocephala subalpina]|uniref:Heterokaryon incompatibility domain-containing protein n=1 Tax=Phialocephala subalpina TaxID=576137 RepID=A0A1L7WS92_9HELO|nr:uncharacterized protein PAC_05529 [Phialocephala subalpina]
MESNEGSTYQYTPLQERGAIRLIDLQPSPDVEAPVECSLVHTTLYDCDTDILNHYTALSYVWGDAQDTRTILVDGRNLDITANLDSALRHLRDKSRTRRIWADAVCISQHDLEEKAIQVQQMGEVYRTAQRTVIYLGEATKYSNAVFNHVCQRHMQSFGGVSSFPNAPIPSRLKVHDIISRTWFKRVWTFQELLLSRDPWLQCGEAKAPWYFFAKYLQGRPNPLSDHHESQQAYRTFLDMHASRDEFRRRDDLEDKNLAYVMRNLFDYMIKRGGLGVSNPVDMVYAHLGIAGYSHQDEGRLGIRIDYHRTLKQVFEEFTGYIIQGTMSYNVLSYAEADVEFDQRDHGLASWCPDWRFSGSRPSYISIRETIICMKHNDPMAGLGVTQRILPFLTANSLECTFIPPAFLPSILASVGVILGTITAVSSEITADQASLQCEELDEPDDNGDFELDTKVFESISRHWEDILPMPISYPSKPLVSFWRSRSRPPTRNYTSRLNDRTLFSSNAIAEHLVLHASKTQLPLPPFLQGRRFAQIEAGPGNHLGHRLAVVPTIATVGDVACLLEGSEIPYILRPYAADLPWLAQAAEYNFASGRHFRYVGEAFIDNLMGRDKEREPLDSVFPPQRYIWTSQVAETIYLH